MQDLTQYQKGQILQNPSNKDVLLVISSEQITINRTTLFNPKTGNETTYESSKERPITLGTDYQLIKPGFAIDRVAIDFREIDLDTIERFILSEKDLQILKSKLAQINAGNLYPTFYESDAEKGVKTTANNPALVKD